MRSLILATSVLALNACASIDHQVLGPPSVVAAPGETAPVQASFYADCIAQAASAKSYDREGRTVRFHCSGAPAQAFYEGLDAYTASRDGTQISAEGRTWRYTQAIHRDPSGLDYCSASDGPTPDFACTIVLNVGAFLEQ